MRVIGQMQRKAAASHDQAFVVVDRHGSFVGGDASQIAGRDRVSRKPSACGRFGRGRFGAAIDNRWLSINKHNRLLVARAGPSVAMVHSRLERSTEVRREPRWRSSSCEQVDRRRVCLPRGLASPVVLGVGKQFFRFGGPGAVLWLLDGRITASGAVPHVRPTDSKRGWCAPCRSLTSAHPRAQYQPFSAASDAAASRKRSTLEASPSSDHRALMASVGRGGARSTRVIPAGS